MEQLTKRELLAGLAMQGYMNVLANPNTLKGMKATTAAQIAVKLADALIAELDKPKHTEL